MNGAECIIKAARDSGIEVCFANPGTTELPLAVALDTVGGIRPVLGLFEGVCTGAADGYARMRKMPGKCASHLTDLAGIDWVNLGQGMGVPSVKVTTAEELARELGKALHEQGPHLIQMMM